MRTVGAFGIALFCAAAIGCDSTGSMPGTGGDGGRPVVEDGGLARDGGVNDGGALDGGADAGPRGPDDGGIPSTCETGGLTGRACAPDGMTSISNALVIATGLDCRGQVVRVETRAGADGRWTLLGLPATDVDVSITVGSFVLSSRARVIAGVTTLLDSSKTCFRSNALKMAVITGNGDQIETLLTQLGFAPDLIDGKVSGDGGVPPAAAFLTDMTRLATYQVLFIDCAAFTRRGVVNLGPNAAAILTNLRAFVAGGGSLYSSDWGGAILALAYPDQVVLRLVTGGDTQATRISSPFDTDRLIGYAPQDVTGAVRNADLSAYLGRARVDVTFPMSPPTNHWSLLAGARSGVSADIVSDVSSCNAGDCMQRGPFLTNVPLAISFRPTPAPARGGNVIFTSFHNIAQTTDDVKRILQFLIFRL